MLHLATVEPDTLGLLRKLMTLPYMDRFFLVGGTALSLQMGHRKSIDLDFFCLEDFNKEDLLLKLQKDFEIQVDVISPSLFLTRIDDIKVDFVRFRYELQYPMFEVEGIRMANVKDIAPMKLDAVTKRGSKKDFFDIYYLLQHQTLQELLDLYDSKYKLSTLFHVIKSLTYFDDAEEDLDPFIFDKAVTWSKVKKHIQIKVSKLYA